MASVLLLASCAEQPTTDIHENRDAMTRDTDLHFIDDSTSPSVPPKLTHNGVILGASLVDWNTDVGDETFEEFAVEQTLNKLETADPRQDITLELSTGAELLAAELSYYSPGSSTEDFNSDPHLRVDCLADDNCVVNYQSTSTEITIKPLASMPPGSFVGLYVEYPAPNRPDGAFFNSEAWALQLGD